MKLVHFAEEANWPPFTPNKSGKVTEGLSYDLMKEIFSRLNIEIELELFPQKRMLGYLMAGQKDAATLISKNSERLKFIDYTVPMFQKKGLIYFLAERTPPIKWQNYEDLKGLKLGGALGHNYGDEFNQAVTEHNLILDRSRTVELNFKKVLKKRIDALLCIELTAQTYLKHPEYKGKIIHASKPYYSKDYHIGFSKAAKAKVLIPRVNKVIQQMKQDGSLQRIISLYIE
ncbi:MAG: amino acid ABC transporter substrate-binding protein [Desulfobacterales bacterium]|nr:amino acid ABC transporter substrate-binding protein [Desulfobacterales bacterium]